MGNTSLQREGAAENETDENDSSSTAIVDTWIGVDVGTTNCSVAVWDSGGSRAKWLKLDPSFATAANEGGRLLPSVLLLATQQVAEEQLEPVLSQHSSSKSDVNYQDVSDLLLPSNGKASSTSEDNEQPGPTKVLVAYVGAPAQFLLERLEEHEQLAMDQVSAGTVTSIKRLWSCLESKGVELEQTIASSSTLDLVVEGSSDIQVRVHPLGYSAPLLVSPTRLVAILMRALRLAANAYLRRRRQRKRKQPLIPPGGSQQPNYQQVFNCAHCVLGVPAAWSSVSRQRWIKAARLAGFSSSVILEPGMDNTDSTTNSEKGISTLIESTAATMAYGLLVSERVRRTILVLDMGGGTTDITIAQTTIDNHSDSNSSGNFVAKERLADMKVLVTEGDAQLGGDDMDAALLNFVLDKAAQTGGVRCHDAQNLAPIDITPGERTSLLRQCQRAKERLCGDNIQGDKRSAPEEEVEIVVRSDCRITVTRKDLDACLEDCLARLGRLVEAALNLYNEKTRGTESGDDVTATDQQNSKMDEVVLIGGATRVPAVRQLLRNFFPPPPELCTAVHPMAAVSQGAAIQAAVESQLVPLHVLRSALMLDTVPHAMGVLVPSSSPDEEGRFVEILARDSPLPARGSARFELATVDQPGVTVVAVEHVHDRRHPYQLLGDFTFLLHRLTPAQKQQHPSLRAGHRCVDIAMTLTENGEFIVSVLDENDPEQRRKFSLMAVSERASNNKLSYSVEEEVTTEVVLLLVACFVLFLLYVAVKILFHGDLPA